MAAGVSAWAQGQAPAAGAPPAQQGGTPADRAAAAAAAMKAPFAPFHIIGNIYYVGSTGIACYVITTPAGDILLDTGYPDMAPQIEDNIKALGFKLSDIKILINSHAHVDHGGGLAELKNATGAKLVAMAQDVPYLEGGGHNDVLFHDQNLFPAVKVDRVIHDGDTVALGGITLKAYLTAGHTPGTTTWTMTTQDKGKSYNVVFLGSVVAVPTNKLVDKSDAPATYPGIKADFDHAFAVVKGLPCDVFLSSNGSFFQMQEKHDALLKGADPNPFIDPAGYQAYVARSEASYQRILQNQISGNVAAAQPSQQGGSAQCDRACLLMTTNIYLAALVAHDPSIVKFSPDAKFVENTVPMKPGEGLWKTASAIPTTFKIYVPDTVSGEIGFLGVMEENNRPIELGLRLKIRDGEVVEAEHLIARNLRDTSLPNLQLPRPGLLKVVPPDQRSPRDEMLKIGASYYEALTTSNGHAAPFADDCVRRENGFQTTGNPPPATPGFGSMGALGCAAQLDTRVMSYIKRIEPRRVEIADPETGLVFGLSQFRHPMEEKALKIVGVPGVDHVDMNFKPFDLPAAHIYKIQGGKIHEIEAMGFSMPYNSKTGWE
ncbi:MAG: subclass B3 metallo-beta-lactamase [Acidobacteriia bacterium]|nr:subclass B3 metallo-beta-lactamase [Terriglobia bacterium]